MKEMNVKLYNLYKQISLVTFKIYISQPHIILLLRISGWLTNSDITYALFVISIAQ